MNESVVGALLKTAARLIEAQCAGEFGEIVVAFGASYDSSQTSKDALYIIPGRSTFERAARDGWARAFELEAVLISALNDPGSADEYDRLSAKLEYIAAAFAAFPKLEAGGFRWQVQEIETFYADPQILEQNLVYNGRVELSVRAAAPLF